MLFYDHLIDAVILSRSICSIPIQASLDYACGNNFLGRVVKGYCQQQSSCCWLTQEAALALCRIQNELNQKGLRILVFDAFRPIKAVRDFQSWFLSPVEEYEKKRKKYHYPFYEKEQLIDLGYAASDISQHCYGHVIDMTIVDAITGIRWDMGTIFDFFGPQSHWDTQPDLIGHKAYENRHFLLDVMTRFGFEPYACEWWHFSYSVKSFHLPLEGDYLDLL